MEIKSETWYINNTHSEPREPMLMTQEKLESLPSKELLSEVLGVNVKTIYHINSNPNLEKFDLPYSINSYGDLLSINIYELAHMCKEWAYRKGYSLISGIFIVADDNGNAVFDYFNSCLISYIEKGNRKQVLNNFKADTEAGSIFKACEYIMEQTK